VDRFTGSHPVEWLIPGTCCCRASQQQNKKTRDAVEAEWCSLLAALAGELLAIQARNRAAEEEAAAAGKPGEVKPQKVGERLAVIGLSWMQRTNLLCGSGA
jgi:hypothetical protein